MVVVFQLKLYLLNFVIINLPIPEKKTKQKKKHAAHISKRKEMQM